MLFVLFAQPLMKLFDKCSNCGKISGLQIFEQKNLVYQLFADDTCLFLRNSQVAFEQARAAIQIFENIFGARLNMRKSVIVPLTNPFPRIGTLLRDVRFSKRMRL